MWVHTLMGIEPAAAIHFLLGSAHVELFLKLRPFHRWPVQVNRHYCLGFLGLDGKRHREV